MQLIRSRVFSRLGMEFFFGRRDLSTSRPYIVATDIMIGSPEFNTEKVHIEQDLIQLFIYADTDEDASSICKELEKEFIDGGEVPFDGGKVIQFSTSGFNISEVPRRHPTADILWLGLFKLKMLVQRTVAY